MDDKLVCDTTMQCIERAMKGLDKQRDEILVNSISSAVKNALMNKEEKEGTEYSALEGFEVLSIIADRINKNNVDRIINSLFDDEVANLDGVIKILSYVGIDCKSLLRDNKLPNEWDRVAIDEFFDTLEGGNLDTDNIRLWQLLLRNPLLNSYEYAMKMAEAISTGDIGLKFCEIYKYKTLDKENMSLLVNNIKIDSNIEAYGNAIVKKYYTDKDIMLPSEVFELLVNNVELIDDIRVVYTVYENIANRIYSDNSMIDYMIKMPERFQVMYLTDDKWNFADRIVMLGKSKLEKREGIQLILNNTTEFNTDCWDYQ